MILHATDLHFRKDAYAALAREALRLGADVCISGDLLDPHENREPIAEQVEWVSDWVRNQPFRTFLCSGNADDDPLSENYADWLQHLHDGNRVFTDGHVGKSSAGGTVACLGFNLGPCGRHTRFLLNQARVVVTHIGPTGTPTSRAAMREDFGDPELAESLFLRSRRSPLVVLCGHVHRPARKVARVNGCVIVNPGGCGSTGHQLPYAIIDERTGKIAFGQVRIDSDVCAVG